MEKLLAFPNFEASLLIKFAVRVGGDFETAVRASEAAELIAGRFRKSWIEVAAHQLQAQKLLTPISSFDARYVKDGDNETLFKLTPDGLKAAIEQAEYNGIDLWAEIEELELRSDLEASSPDFIPEGRVITVDQTSQLFIDLERQIRDTLKHAQINNELMNEIAGQRRIKEVEAGQILLQSESVDVGLVRRTLLPAFHGLLKLVRDETLKAIIKRAIEALIAYIATP
ncbi:hypothetical protein [Rhizobium leguminosarum]|uniref:hypothetical protein n=1 Tax=Rhizobium leguminosarum TaxID=384 RepID=UPI003F9674C2